MRRVKKTVKMFLIIVLVCIICIPPICVFGATTGKTSFLDDLDSLKRLGSAKYLTREAFCVAISKLFLTDSHSETVLPFEDADLLKPENLPYLITLYDKGILSGFDYNGQPLMEPDLLISRQQAFTLMGKLIGVASEYELTYADADMIESSSYKYVAWFAETGLISVGPDEYFNPNSPLTSDEFVLLAFNLLVSTRNVKMTSLSGTGGRGLVDGENSNAGFLIPQGVVATPSKEAGRAVDIVVFDTYNNVVRVINDTETNTIAGGIDTYDDSRFPQGDYVDATSERARFNRPVDGVYNSRGDLFIADSQNHLIRRFSNGRVYTFSGSKVGYADGSGATARFNTPVAIAIDKYDNIYVADALNNCIRRVDPQGRVTTVAGVPGEEGYKDGGANSSLFRTPGGIAVNSDGSVIYVADTGNHMIRKIENGIVTTVAGILEEIDADGEPLGGLRNGAASHALFNQPKGIALAGDLLIVSDSGNNMIRAVTSTGLVFTLAGNGEPGDEDGHPLGAVLNHPTGVCYSDGMLYISDSYNNKIKALLEVTQ